MKKIIALTIVSLLAVGAATAQEPQKKDAPKVEQQARHGHGGKHCGNCPNHGKHHGGHGHAHGQQAQPQAPQYMPTASTWLSSAPSPPSRASRRPPN